MKTPSKQDPHSIAFQAALKVVRARDESEIVALGARKILPERWELPVLDYTFTVNPVAGTIQRPDEKGKLKAVRVQWQILTLHYLSAPVPREGWATPPPPEEGLASLSGESAAAPAPPGVFSENNTGLGAVSGTGYELPNPQRPRDLVVNRNSFPVPEIKWISFPEIPDARGYDPVYRARVLERLCATAGRDRATFVAAAERIGGRPVETGDAAFEFQVFPRLAVIVVWHAGDDEFPPGATFLYPENIASLLPVEDVVVLAESLVARLQGREP